MLKHLFMGRQRILFFFMLTTEKFLGSKRDYANFAALLGLYELCLSAVDAT